MIKIIIRLALLGVVTRFTLVPMNQFLDPREPVTESLTVESVGKYYQPFRADYIQGRSRVLDRAVRVGVLPERAEQTTIGQSVKIVVGKGLLRKPWTMPQDKHEGCANLTFKVVYLGMFAGFFAILTILHFKCDLTHSRRKATGEYVAALTVGVVLFYLI